MYKYDPFENDANEWFATWEQNVAQFPDEVKFADDNEDVTFRQADELSGKIYDYLYSNGIGKETMVLLVLPRGVKMFVAMIGVLKAGAAFICVEEGYPQNRIDFIAQDASAALTIDEALYETIISNNPCKSGYQPADNHDAAFAVYTSGTTGTPKGVLQERGVMAMANYSTYDNGGLPKDSFRFAVIAPLNFSATILIFCTSGNDTHYLYIPSYDIIKNPPRLFEQFEKRSITSTFMAPAMVKLLGHAIPNYLKIVFVGAAPADNIELAETCKLRNYYMSTETCFVLSQYDIASSQAHCPVGKPHEGITCSLDEEGQVVVFAPFSRGYLNPTEQQANAFKDGYYYTGDLATYDENGDLVLVGRVDDMVKINGNRVEPAEIEASFTKHTGLACVAKGFDELSDSFVAVYYVDNGSGQELDIGAVAEAMQNDLPYYMIPSFFVKIDSIPMTAVGKVDRKSLAKPTAQHRAYLAPVTDLEKRFCAVMQKILGIDKVGLNDDFFQLGASSMDVIEAIADLSLDGLTAEMFYRGRTPGNIAAIYQEVLDQNQGHVLTEEEAELEGRKHQYPIRDSALALFFFAEYAPNSTAMLNLAAGCKLSKLINLKKLCKVVNEYTDNASMFKTITKKNEEGVPVFVYAPELYKPLEIEEMSEEEAQEAIATFVQPFHITEELPWRIRFIKTKSSQYFLCDIHHILTDGAGLNMFYQDIANAYLGKETQTNNFYAWLYEVENDVNSSYFQECRRIQMDVFHDKPWGYEILDKTDEIAVHVTQLSTGIKLKDLDAWSKRTHNSRGVLLGAAAALAVARFSDTEMIQIDAMYDNRTGVTNIGGVRTTTLNYGFHMSQIHTLEELLEVATIERERAFATCRYCYSTNDGRPLTGFVCVDDLGDIENFPPALAKFVERLDLPRPDEVNASEPSALGMLTNFLNLDGELWIRAMRDVFFVSDETREKYVSYYIEALNRIMKDDDSVVTEFNPFV